mmetsp:Transcript_2139/g.3068  ORF Transcript_2139/g.3068 Transcript_2139/m.3068 type:complete len:120 (+) Transcript_2139:130-489(+)
MRHKISFTRYLSEILVHSSGCKAAVIRRYFRLTFFQFLKLHLVDVLFFRLQSIDLSSCFLSHYHRKPRQHQITWILPHDRLDYDNNVPIQRFHHHQGLGQNQLPIVPLLPGVEHVGYGR